MVTVPVRRVCLALCLGFLVTAATAQTTVCATVSALGLPDATILLRTDVNLTPNTAVALHGWLTRSDFPLIPLYGTAFVDNKGASMRIAVQGLKNGEGTNNQHQHIGLVVTTDLTLNGSGTYENLRVTPGGPRRFEFDIDAVTSTATICP